MNVSQFIPHLFGCDAGEQTLELNVFHRGRHEKHCFGIVFYPSSSFGCRSVPGITLAPDTTSCNPLATNIAFIWNFQAWKFEPSNFVIFREDISSDIFDPRKNYAAHRRTKMASTWQPTDKTRIDFFSIFRTSNSPPKQILRRLGVWAHNLLT